MISRFLRSDKLRGLCDKDYIKKIFNFTKSEYRVVKRKVINVYNKLTPFVSNYYNTYNISSAKVGFFQWILIFIFISPLVAFIIKLFFDFIMNSRYSLGLFWVSSDNARYILSSLSQIHAAILGILLAFYSIVVELIGKDKRGPKFIRDSFRNPILLSIVLIYIISIITDLMLIRYVSINEEININLFWILSLTIFSILILFPGVGIILRNLINLDIRYDAEAGFLNRMDLEEANLDDMNLRGIDLKQKDLKNASLIKSDLENADLSESNLQYAILSYSNLTEANLNKSNLKEANIINSRLNRANLSETILEGADLSESEMNSAIFLNSNLNEANLNKSKLIEAKINRSQLRHSNISESNLEYAEIKESDLQYVVLSNSNLKNVNMTRSNLKNANIINSNLQKADMSETNLEYTDLSESDMQNAILLNSNLKNTNLTKSDLRGANMVNSQLQRSKMNETNLEGANLSGSNLIGAILNKSKFIHSNLEMANLSRSKLNQVVFRNSKLHETILIGASFDEDSLYNLMIFNNDFDKARLDNELRQFINNLNMMDQKTNEDIKKHINIFLDEMRGNMALLLDTSYSMGENQKIDILKKITIEFLNRRILDEGKFIVIAFNGYGVNKYSSTEYKSAAEKRSLIKTVENFAIYGITPLMEAIQTADNLLNNMYKPTMIIITDGMVSESISSEVLEYVKDNIKYKIKCIDVGKAANVAFLGALAFSNDDYINIKDIREIETVFSNKIIE